MEVKVIGIDELMKDNPDLCLSPHRVFEICHKCQRFKRTAVKYETAEETIKAMKCKPKIRPDIFKMLREKRRLEKRIRELQEKLESLDI
jgi:predicted nuclease with TOPRIM domain